MTERGFMTRRKTVAFAIASVLTFGGTLGAISVPALAEDSATLQTQLDEANSQLSQMGYQLAAAQEDLNNTVVQLNDTQSKIDQLNSDIASKQEELSQAQATLGKRVSANYKTGGVNLVSLVLDSDSFEDLFSRIYYADKVAESDANAISQVKTLQNELKDQQSELEAQKSQQESLVAQKSSQTESLQSQVSDQQSYVASLSDEVRAAVQEEADAQAAAAQQTAANAGANASDLAQAALDSSSNGTSSDAATAGNGGTSDNGASDTSSNTDSGTNTNNNTNTDTTPSTPSTPSKPSAPSTPSTPSAPSTPSTPPNSNSSSDTPAGGLSSAQRSAILSVAYGALGTPYVWGGASASGYDCSGLTMVAYAAAGISLPHSSDLQMNYFTSIPLSQARPGDLIWYSGHVGIYVGNNTILHAPYPGVYVRTERVWGGYIMVGTYR